MTDKEEAPPTRTTQALGKILDEAKMAVVTADQEFHGIKSPAEIEHDSVNHPSHYTAYHGIEIIDLTEQMNFNKGNAVKYIARAGPKSPETELEDLRKARWYLDREIERVLKGQAL